MKSYAPTLLLALKKKHEFQLNVFKTRCTSSLSMLRTSKQAREQNKVKKTIKFQRKSIQQASCVMLTRSTKVYWSTLPRTSTLPTSRAAMHRVPFHAPLLLPESNSEYQSTNQFSRSNYNIKYDVTGGHQVIQPSSPQRHFDPSSRLQWRRRHRRTTATTQLACAAGGTVQSN